MTGSSRARTATLTVATMVAFAANSVLARVALLRPTIDAASLTTIRLTSGAVTLLLVVRVTAGNRPQTVIRFPLPQARRPGRRGASRSGGPSRVLETGRSVHRIAGTRSPSLCPDRLSGGHGLVFHPALRASGRIFDQNP